MSGGYQSACQASLADPEAFWAAAAEGIHWNRRWTTVLDDQAEPTCRWFTGGELNTCFNAVDRHVIAGRGDQPALIFDSAMTGTKRRLTYTQLRAETAHFAGALAGFGLGKGDRVIIYMPMVPEAVIAMLACARLGAIHSVVFGGFAANELAIRIDDAEPKAIISASCGLEPGRVVEYKPLLDAAIDQATHKPDACIVLQRPECLAGMNELDHDWHDVIAAAAPHDCVPVAATDPLYILYTSGTTGKPKGIVRDNGGHAVALNWSMQAIYGVDTGDVFWAASDVGWVVGHSYIVYGPLLRGCTTVMFEGKPVGTPDAGEFWRVIAAYGVKAMFTAPTAIRAIRRVDPDGQFLKKYDLSHYQTQFVAGERCDPETLRWTQQQLGVPVIDHWWQTETGWAIAGNPAGLGFFDVRAGAAGRAMPGWDLQVLGDDDQPVMPGESGAIVCRLPMPPGFTPTIWNAEQRFYSAYFERFPGYYETGDAGFIDEDGYVFVMSRTDDVINVAGHRLSTGAIEEELATHPDVAECAVTGIRDALKGQVPLGFLCLKSGVERTVEEVVNESIEIVRSRIGPVAAFKQAIVVTRLPKTRSGKILRGTLRRMADGDAYTVPATIDDPAILTEIAGQLAFIGLPADRT
ncbi:MAG: propionyl-CoA synthetase [Gammaproteobacteria bacterium]|nr:propionyl-CoA synthetase [Gammaproteobacteria bacterium]